MNRIRSRLVSCSLVCLAGFIVSCSHDAPASSPSATPQQAADLNGMPADVAAMRAAFAEVEQDEQVDAEHARLVNAVVEHRSLVGRARAEITGWLGRGADSAAMRLPASALVYEVGMLRDGYNGGVPMLVVEFDDTNRCVQTRAMHGQ